MKKDYLLAPGPTPVPPYALNEMAKPMIHHRSPMYRQLFEEIREGLKAIFKTTNDVLVLTCSGTGGMEAAVSNFFARGDKVLVVRAGKFGERWAELGRVYGLEVINIDVEWGRSVNPDLIAQALRKGPDIRGVFIQASETSTGARHDAEAIGRLVKDYPQTLLIVDAITALGVFDLATDDWGLDIVVTGSQKALMLPPGLAFVSVSPKAWRAAERSDLPKFYFDLKKEKKSQIKNENAFTPAVSLLIGLQAVLRQLKEDGLEAVFARHDLLARATRAAMLALGLELYTQDLPSNAVTAVKVPEGIDGQALTKQLREKYGITIAGGQDRAKGKIFRLAHLGYADVFDVIIAVSAVEMCLHDLGYKLEFGRGVKAAQEVLSLG